jgi:uncharacterized repeat protein (TIGR03803 family)
MSTTYPFLLTLVLGSTCIAAAQAPLKYATLYSFTGQNGDGASPGALIVAKNGHLLGTTQFGGSGPCTASASTGCGTIFELLPPESPLDAWKETVLYSFGAVNGDGAYPTAGLVFGANGAVYGTTSQGGAQNQGTVFVLTPPGLDATAGSAWTETILHSFAGGARDGAQPFAGLALGQDGTLYGTTFTGGAQDLGTAYALAPPASPDGSWTEKILHSFAGYPGDGSNPNGGLAIDKGGTLYGAAGLYVFALHADGQGAWSEDVLASFFVNLPDALEEPGGVTIGRDGVLYGTTFTGGLPSCIPEGCGGVFAVTPRGSDSGAWTERVISFLGGPPLAGNPLGGVVIGPDGGLLGTTSLSTGTVYSLTPAANPKLLWKEATLHTFEPTVGDGSHPLAGLAVGSGGALYGTTSLGGAANMGTVFELWQ